MKIANFYSTNPNIGNILPVLGIHKMLGQAPDIMMDCRMAHLVNPDSYDVVIVGGAGLFSACFELFWRWLAIVKKPIILWGVGGTWARIGTPLGKDKLGQSVDPRIIRKMSFEMVNVRDTFTAEYYGFKDADISICPTFCYFDEKEPLGRESLYAHHPGLASKETLDRMREIVTDTTDNVKRGKAADVVKKYINARYVITTRLHGCIIANALGRPYIAFNTDKKIYEYHRLYGGGYLLEDIDALIKEYKKGSFVIRDAEYKFDMTQHIAKAKVFGEKVKEWTSSQK